MFLSREEEKGLIVKDPLELCCCRGHSCFTNTSGFFLSYQQSLTVLFVECTYMYITLKVITIPDLVSILVLKP